MSPDTSARPVPEAGAAGFDADVPAADEPVDADDELDVDKLDVAGVPTAALATASLAIDPNPAGVVSDASPLAVTPVSWDSAEVEVPASPVVPGAPWVMPGSGWLPLKGTTPVDAPTTASR